MRSRTKIMSFILCFGLLVAPLQRSEAAVPLAILEIIKKGVKKVIVAIDLKIQRQQNKVIWLQNAQKVIENTMSKLKLDEIKDWTERQRKLYADYFEELRKVKMAITYYNRIKEISQTEALLVQEYQRFWRLIQKDPHFTAEERIYMGKVYSGILAETVKNVEQLTLVVQSFTTQMSDAQRLEMINKTAEQVMVNYTDLQTFNRQNARLSIQRAGSQQELKLLRNLYGID